MAFPAIDLAETMVTAASRATGTALRMLMSGAHAACLAVRRSALRSHQRLRTDRMRCRRDVWHVVDRSGDALPAGLNDALRLRFSPRTMLLRFSMLN